MRMQLIKGYFTKINKHDPIINLVLTLTSKHVLSNKIDHHTTWCTSKAIYLYIAFPHRWIDGLILPVTPVPMPNLTMIFLVG